MLKIFHEPNIKGCIAQPSNTVTAIAYVIVACLILNNDNILAITLFFVAIGTIALHATDTLKGLCLDLVSISILVIIFLIKGFPFTEIIQKDLWIGMALLFIAGIFWIIDIKHISIIPQNHILTGHGVWHILTAISVWFFYLALPIR